MNNSMFQLALNDAFDEEIKVSWITNFLYIFIFLKLDKHLKQNRKERQDTTLWFSVFMW